MSTRVQPCFSGIDRTGRHGRPGEVV